MEMSMDQDGEVKVQHVGGGVLYERLVKLKQFLL
jgi:hypothetical protein